MVLKQWRTAQALWHSLLAYQRDRGLLVEGPLTALRPSHAALSKPDSLFDRCAFVLGARISSRYRPSECVIHRSQADAAAAATTAIGQDHNGLRSNAVRAQGAAGQFSGAMGQGQAGPPLARGFATAPYMAVRPTARFGDLANPFAAAPMLTPQSVLTQDVVSIDQLCEAGMSLSALGGQLYGGGMGIPNPSQGYFDAALPEFHGYQQPSIAPAAPHTGRG